ncbi:hypothetical protein APHAL10511_006751 [Amanita phalloides]|nr:hypothetical protein APHAL10511_006751 [Amanita phalloides]
MLVSFLFALALSASPSLCKQYEFTLTNKNVSPDGGPIRSAIVVNGQTPGPLITANKGDRVQIKIKNRLTDATMAQATSIHWHGIFQPRTAGMDGAGWVTQCPIATGDDFTYSLTLGDQTGTYWYHSHITTQYCDGLRGAIVIYDPQDPNRHLYDVDNANTVITLADWIRNPSPYAYSHFENPETILINGLGRVPGGTKSPLAVVKVQRSVRYRFRVINTACVAGFSFSIDGHELSVIETDGTESKPSNKASVVTIWSGQRVSIVVTADQPPNNYWIRAVPIIVGSLPSQEVGVNAAILRYDGAPEVEPTTTKTGFSEIKEQDLVSIGQHANLSGTPKVKLNFNIGVNAQKTAFTMNGYTFTPPSVPVLLQILSGKVNPYDIMPAGSVIPLPKNQLIEITVPGGSTMAPHPFHLHGHKFGVVRSASSQIVNTQSPVMRDVVNTGVSPLDNVTIRFITDNPGPWIFHCHIDFHLTAGLAVVFAEDVPGQRSGGQSQTVTEAWKELCPKWNATKTGKQYTVSDLY